MISLLNRGIIPKDVDLTPAFEKGAPPVQFRGMKFHDKRDMHVRATVNTQNFSINNIKFDLQPIPESIREDTVAIIPRKSPSGMKALMPNFPVPKQGKTANMQLALPAPEMMNGPGEMTTGKGGNTSARGYNELMDEYSLH